MCTHTNIYTYMKRTQREGGLESRKMKAGEKETDSRSGRVYKRGVR